MVSFSTETKNELCRLESKRPCCQRAELAALLKASALLTKDGGQSFGLSFATENAAVARLVLVRLKAAGIVATEVAVSRQRRLKKNNHYEVHALPAVEVDKLIADLGLMPGAAAEIGKGFLRRSCCQVAYLKGAFLAAGSVSRPGADYHLEIVVTAYQFAEFILALLQRLNFPAALTERKDTYVIYLKEADAIADFLGLVGAGEAAEKFEISRNVKEVRNQVNRLVNCETANLQKTVDAAARQIAAIEALLNSKKAARLSEPLLATARARLEHPEATLNELAKLLGVGKSGVNHRLRRLLEIAGN